MRIALAQINPTLGDIEGNLKKHLRLMEQAAAKNCDLIVFPEMSLLGYSPNDLLERPEILQAHDRALQSLIKAKPKNIDWIVGGLDKNLKKINIGALGICRCTVI